MIYFEYIFAALIIIDTIRMNSCMEIMADQIAIGIVKLEFTASRMNAIA